MRFMDFTLNNVKYSEGLYQSVFSSHRGNIKGWGLTQESAISHGKLCILKHIAMCSKYPSIVYQPDISFILYANDRAEKLFENAYELFNSLQKEDRKILESTQEFELTVDDRVFDCLATDYRIPTRLRYFQFQGLPEKDLNFPHNCGSSLGEV